MNQAIAHITQISQPLPLAGYRSDIGLFFSGELSSKNIAFVAGSRMLELIGIGKIKAKIPTAKLAEIITKHTEVTQELMLQVPLAFANPIAIFKSKTVPDRLVALTSITTNKGDINIPFLILRDKKSDEPYLTIITSIYGRPESQIINWIEEGLLIIGHKKKIHNYLLISRCNCMKAQATMNLYANVEKYVISPDYFNKKINSLEGLATPESSNFYLITPQGAYLSSTHQSMVSVNFGAVEVTSNNRVAQINPISQTIPLAGYSDDLRLFYSGNLNKNDLEFTASSRMLELAGIDKIHGKIPKNKLNIVLKDHPEVNYEILFQIPLAIANPIAILKSKTIAERKVVVTTINTQNGQIVLPIAIKQIKGNKEAIIASIYPKKATSILNWIEGGYLIIGHKKKIHNYLLFSRSNCAQAQATMNLYANVGDYIINTKFISNKLSGLSDSENHQSPRIYLDTPNGLYLVTPRKNLNYALGAVEVTSNNRVAHVDGISANGEPIDYSGFRPTYKILQSYDHLITRALGNTQSVGDQGIKYVLDKCRQIAIDGRSQVAHLAAHLHSHIPEQAAFNVWHFIKTNIRYATENDEQLRTPARTWADRLVPGVDCDDYATFSAALLMCMGHKPTFEVVGFGKDGAWSHIYTMLGTTVIDPVMNTFNAHPIKITNRMQVHILSGLDGLSGINADTLTIRAVNQLIAERNRLAEENPSNPEISKIDFVIAKSGSTAFVPWLKLMPWIISINPETGAITWKDSAMKSPGLEALLNEIAATTEVETALEGFLSGAPAWPASVIEFGRMIDSINNSEMPPEVLEILQKIKDKKQVTLEELNRVNAWMRAASKDRGTQREMANRNVPIWRRLLRGMAQIDPLLIAARNAFLGLTAVNFRGMAKQMGIGLVTVEEAQRLGWTAAQYMGVKNGWFTFMARWADLGGNPGLLKDRIQTGRGKKPVWGTSDRVKNLYGLGDGGATAAMVTAAASIIGTLMSLVKNMVGSGGSHPDANPKPEAGEQGTPLTDNLPANTGTTPAFEWPGNTM